MSSIVIFGRDVGCLPKKERIPHLRITTKLEKKSYEDSSNLDLMILWDNRR